MMTQATLGGDGNGFGQVLYMALELSNQTWKVLFATPSGRRREVTVPARDMDRLLAEVVAAKAKLKLAADAPVVSCYEAGRDGFWLDRALRSAGIANSVVDSASIEVPQHARRCKTDHVDLGKLMDLLLRRARGETGALKTVRVPAPDSEDVRQLSRGIDRLKCERGRHVSRLKSLLATQGVVLAQVGGKGWAELVVGLTGHDGKPLGGYLVLELQQEGERLALVDRQLALSKAERERLVATSPEPVAVKARALTELCGIAAESSFVFATELFGWRQFANRRELAGAVGLTPTPFQSGALAREQGVSKSGNRRMRTMLVEIAWCWLRYQKESALSQWFQRRFVEGGRRAKKVGIVALARKLLVALWRYLEHGVVPEGARFKTERSKTQRTRTAAARPGAMPHTGMAGAPA